MDMDLQQPGPVDGQTNGNVEEDIGNKQQEGSIATPSQTSNQTDLHSLSTSADGSVNSNLPSTSSSQPLPIAASSSLPSSQFQSQSTNPPLSQDVASNSNPNSTPTSASPSQPQTQPTPQSHPQSQSDPNNINTANANANTPRQPPHPDSPLPPALQAQFYARFRIQPPQTHGQLQQFLRQAAQAQAAFQARSANMNMNTNGATPGVRQGESAGEGPGAGPGSGAGAGDGPGPMAMAMNTNMNTQAGGMQTLPNLNPNSNPNQRSNPSSGAGTPTTQNVQHAEQSSNTGVLSIPVNSAAESASGQKTRSHSGTPNPNTPAQAVENGTSTPKSGITMTQPGPSSLGTTAQAIGPGQNQTPQLNEQTLAGTPAESDSINLPPDVPSFRPRQLSGSDRGDLHAALASVVKSPAGNTLALGGPGAGVGVGGNGIGSGPHFDGLGRLPAGMDMEAIRRQMQALRESQNRRSSASGSQQPMMAGSPGYNPISNPLGAAGMGANGSAVANSPLDMAMGAGSSPAMVTEGNGDKSGHDQQAQSQAGQGTNGTENVGNGAEAKVNVQQGVPENASGTPLSAVNEMGPQQPQQQQQSQQPQRRPTNPNQAAFAAHFLHTLRQFVTARNIPTPPNLFVNEPADPEVPGSTPTPAGALDVFGKKVDIFRLYFTVVQMGGCAKVAAIDGWAKLAASWGFPPFLPSPWTLLSGNSQASSQQFQMTRTTTIPGEMLLNIYETVLRDFEEQSRIGQAAQAAQAAKMQQQQQLGRSQQAQPAGGVSTGPSGNVGSTDDRDPSKSNQPINDDGDSKRDLPPSSDNASEQVHKSASGIHDSSTTVLEETAKLDQTPVTATQAGSSSRPASRAGSTLSQIAPSSSLGLNRPEGEMLAHRQRMLLQAQTKAMLQGVPSPTMSIRSNQDSGPSGNGRAGSMNGYNGSSSGPGSNDQEAATGLKRKLSDLAKPREKTPEPLPKRIRYKIEYRPLSRMVDAHGGWDVEAVALAHRDNALAREALMVEDLGRVDIEALSMSIRSRIPSELSYALTVLGMLSMPGKGDDKGGLGLGHCGDLLDDLVDLVEDEAFGEDGWKEWADKVQAISTTARGPLQMTENRKTPHKDLLVSAQVEDYSRAEANQSHSSRRVEVVLLVVSLLRNFSLMADNYTIMTRHARFVEIMIRVCDPRLTLPISPVWSQNEGPAMFKQADHLRIREDVLDVFHGLSASLNLRVLPLDAVGLMVELALSHLKGSQTDLISDRLFRGPADPLDMPDKAVLALEILTQTSCSDPNRRVLRQLDGDTIVEVFLTCLKYLAFDEQDAKMLLHYPPMLDVQVKLAFCLYNFAFVASLPARARLRETVGVLSVLGTSIHLLSRATAHPYAVMVRCLSETIGVLNGPDDLMGERRQLTFGSGASVRGLKGWNDAQDVMEQGILAGYEDRLLVDFLAVGRAAGQLDKATFEAISRSVWAL